MIRHLPNTITCLNLVSGCMGIVFAFNGDLHAASWAIIIAAILDFMDGMVARALNAYSAIGKELDSLADMVSFGVLPSVMVFHLFLQSGIDPSMSWLKYLAFIIAVFSALRLAKFNIDTRQAEHFIGLPTPANAMVVASLPFIKGDYAQSAYFFDQPLLIAGMCLVLSFLLVSEIPLLSLKFKNLNMSQNLLRYILVFSSLILVAILKFAAVPIIIIVYFLVSFIHFRPQQ